MGKRGALQLGTSSAPCDPSGLRAEPGRASDERRLLGGDAEDHLGIWCAPEREMRVRMDKPKSRNKLPCFGRFGVRKRRRRSSCVARVGGEWLLGCSVQPTQSQEVSCPLHGSSIIRGHRTGGGKPPCVCCATFSVSLGSRTGF